MLKKSSSSLEAYCDQTPYLKGVSWTVAMEAGLRLISLCWIVGFLKGYLRKKQLFTQPH